MLLFSKAAILCFVKLVYDIAILLYIVTYSVLFICVNNTGDIWIIVHHSYVHTNIL